LAQHPSRIQSFDHDLAVGFGKTSGQGMDVVAADVGDPAMKPGNLLRRLVIAARALAAARLAP
jgi:hypothetical protein